MFPNPHILWDSLFKLDPLDCTDSQPVFIHLVWFLIVQNPALALTKPDINWVSIIDQYHEWKCWKHLTDLYEMSVLKSISRTVFS